LIIENGMNEVEEADLDWEDDFLITHTCEFPGCTKQIPQDRVLCYFHWMKVPKPLQADVYATWSERRREETPTTRRKHQNAKALAIKAVQEILLTGTTRVGGSDWEGED